MRDLSADHFVETVRLGKLEEVKKLLKDNPALVNEENYTYTTALMEAVREDHREIVEFLVESGADVNHKNFSYVTALWHAVAKNNADLTQYLLEHGADPNIRDPNRITLQQQAETRWNAYKAARVLKEWPARKRRLEAEKKQRELNEKAGSYSPGLKKPMPIPRSPFRPLK